MTHPITPLQWQMDAWQARIETMGADVPAILLEAAQWGADQELEACLRLVEIDAGEDAYDFARYIRAARRPKPPSLKEQALADLDKIESSDRGGYAVADLTAIRRALEAIND